MLCVTDQGTIEPTQPRAGASAPTHDSTRSEGQDEAMRLVSAHAAKKDPALKSTGPGMVRLRRTGGAG